MALLIDGKPVDPNKNDSKEIAYDLSRGSLRQFKDFKNMIVGNFFINFLDAKLKNHLQNPNNSLPTSDEMDKLEKRLDPDNDYQNLFEVQKLELRGNILLAQSKLEKVPKKKEEVLEKAKACYTIALAKSAELSNAHPSLCEQVSLNLVQLYKDQNLQ